MPTPGPVAEHKARSPAPSEVRIAILTASDSRTPDTNEGGRTLRRAVEAAGFQVVFEALMSEEPAALREQVAALARGGEADAVLVTGGTGIAPRDRTPDAIAPLFERRLPGFGELFRMLSFQEIGPAAMLSRADAGDDRRDAGVPAARLSRGGRSGRAPPDRARAAARDRTTPAPGDRASSSS